MKRVREIFIIRTANRLGFAGFEGRMPVVNAGELLYIVCKNLTDVFRAEKALQEAGIPVRTVPSPPKEVGPCSTVLEITVGDSKRSSGVLEQSGLEIEKTIPARLPRTELLERLSGKNNAGSFGKVLSGVLEGLPPSLPDLRILLKASGTDREALWKAADYVRQISIGDVVDIRAALEFSNHCRRNCSYCGLRQGNSNLSRYRMTENEILEQAVRVRSMGIQTIILQSGEDTWYTTARVVNIIKAIKQETGMYITLSLGEREPEEYGIFRQAGADNYLLKVETTNPHIYSALHPGSTVTERIKHVRMIKQAGYITGSGNIIGLPGQDVDSIARDIIWFWQEGIHMIGVGPFVPAVNTPLETNTPGAVDLTLNTIAVTRLVCRNSYIPSTTALATLSREAQLKGLACGANTIMLIMTPPGVREKYKIYANKMMVDIEWALTMVKALQRQTPPYIQAGGLAEPEQRTAGG
ncbi:MAG: [FeFe] hydrogenase H-cluster radical SAM maturase HydE [Eubacteriales bacterium]